MPKNGNCAKLVWGILVVLVASAIFTACDVERRKSDAELGLNPQQSAGRKIYDGPPEHLQADVELIKQKRGGDCEIYVYAGADHGFNCEERGSYNEAAAKLARERSIAFLNKHMKR